MQRIVFLIGLSLFLTLTTSAQDSLPRFSVKNRSGKVIVSWNNPFQDVVLINVQRSMDSLTGFKTILSVADPSSVSNGFLDAKAPDTKQFYRLYVQRGGGVYFFTLSAKPVVDTIKRVPANAQQNPTTEEKEGIISPSNLNKTGQIKKFTNGISVTTDSVMVQAPSSDKIFTPSVFVYTNQQGHVVLALPHAKSMAYSIRFYKEDGTHLFTMNKIKEPYLTIDKTNFFRSGWFLFELYENNLVKEKHKLFIPKER